MQVYNFTKICQDLSSVPHDMDVLLDAQGASLLEMSLWCDKGVRDSYGLWRGPRGQTVLPICPLSKAVLEEAYDPSHVEIQTMMGNLHMWWHSFMSDLVRDHCNNCNTC
ncbi:hypothetical protein NL108_016782 [Boleophthalmus pectinirostris]|nr:hypothetical protein NL108_016782 [Boleophthalmus pectinirostris]